LPAEKLRSVLGLSSVTYIQRRGSLAVADRSLE
jgi:hypothetical protein